jgi:hypothetical protein
MTRVDPVQGMMSATGFRPAPAPSTTSGTSSPALKFSFDQYPAGLEQTSILRPARNSREGSGRM